MTALSAIALLMARSAITLTSESHDVLMHPGVDGLCGAKWIVLTAGLVAIPGQQPSLEPLDDRQAAAIRLVLERRALVPAR